MDDNVRDLRRCQGIKGDGTPCERIVKGSDKFCYAHDQSKAQERKAHAAKAGRSKGVSGALAEVKQRLRTLADEVLAGKADKGNAAVAGQLLGTYIRAHAAELKEREQRELIERLERLERQQPTYRSSGYRR